MKQIVRTFLFVAAALAAGCASRVASTARPSYETIAPSPDRDRDAAAKAHADALKLIEKDRWPEAEAMLKRALSLDVMNGPAHNSLGHVYFHDGDYYQAAWEFQYASKLMPNRPEPRNNLGLVFEATGKLDEAIDSYEKAVEIEPDNPQFIGNEARARVRRGDARSVVRPLLTKLIAVDTRPPWRDWSAGLIRRYDQRPTSDPTTMPSSP